MNQWTLIKQVSASEEPAGPLDNGRTTQPTPQAISSDEFSLAGSQPVHEIPAVQSSATQPVTQAQSIPMSSEVPPPPAGFGLLDALRETLPPTPVQPAPAPAHPAQHQPVHTTPTLHAQSVIPDSGAGLLDSLRKAMPEAPQQPAPVKTTQSEPQPAIPAYHQPPVQNSAPAYNPAPVRSPAPVVSASPASADANQRFKQMFKQRAPQPASAYLHRDTPLQPLLEMIASCR